MVGAVWTLKEVGDAKLALGIEVDGATEEPLVPAVRARSLKHSLEATGPPPLPAGPPVAV